MRSENIQSQTIGAITEHVNNLRTGEMISNLAQIAEERVKNLNFQDVCFNNALNKVEEIRKNVATPSKILGSDLTKHGEIAEMVEVGITNARNALKGLEDSATFENIGRTAPEDYLMNGMKVQSKFINGTNNTLKHILEHMDKYEYFGRDSSSFYHIPRDQYEVIMKVVNGEEVSGLSERSIKAILEKVNQIEKSSGKPFSEIIKPAISKYSEVQTNKVNETLDRHTEELTNDNDEMKKNIKQESKKKADVAKEQGQPSFGEATKVAGIAAVVSGGMTLAINVYKKRKEGKSFSDYSLEDWKEIGVDVGSKSIKGGVTGYAVYGLTNYTTMSAPMAGALVSATFGVSSLLSDYRNERIGFEDFVEQSEALCFETSLVALGGAIGQSVIPIPVVGAVIGSITANILVELGKNTLNEKEQQKINEYKKRYFYAVKELDYRLQIEFEKIVFKFNKLGDIMEFAFNFDINSELRFYKSIELATECNVKEAKILKSMNDIESYFTN